MKHYHEPKCFGKYSKIDVYCHVDECEYSIECCKKTDEVK